MKDMPEDKKTQCFTHTAQGCDGTTEGAERTDQAQDDEQKPETD